VPIRDLLHDQFNNKNCNFMLDIATMQGAIFISTAEFYVGKTSTVLVVYINILGETCTTAF